MLVKTVAEWVDERLGVGREVAALMAKPIKGGARYLFSLGAVNLFLFVNQVVTGMLLMLYYAPTPDHAYEAVQFIQHDAPFGFVIRGLHYWGASAMVVCVILHVTRVYIYGAYKKPREIMWLSGVVLLLLVFGFAFTGYLLPWDQKAYWATVVGTNVGGTAPIVGGYVVRLMRGGAEVGNLTLTRFFMLHTMLLPWLLALIAGIHLTVLQLVDHTPPWDPVQARREAPFYPEQVFKDAVLTLGVFVLLLVLASVAPAGLEALADPTDHSYNPRPEWYFYFLFQILHYTEGPFEVVGTMVLPNLFVLVLLALPFIDRAPERDPKKRPLAMTAITAVLVGYISLTVIAALGTTPEAVAKGPETPQAIHGRQLYDKLGCAACHAIHGVGGKVGPALDHEGAKRRYEWLVGHFKDPQKYSPGSLMPKFDYLPAADLEDLTQYMLSLK